MNVKKNYVYLFLVFVLIYFGSNTLYSQVVLSSQVSSLLVFSLTVALYVYNVRKNSYFCTDSIIILALMILFILVAVVINWDLDNMNGYLIIFMKMIGAYLLLKVLDFSRLLKAYSDIIFAVAIYSLIVTYIFPVFSLEKLFPAITNSMGIRFYNCFLSFKIDSYGMYELRNYGLFSEPAVYCYYLFLAAMFIYANKKLSTYSCIQLCVLIFTMFTTFSPIGFICAVFVYCCMVGKLLNERKSLMTLSACLFSSLIFVAVVLSNAKMITGFEFTISKATLEYGNGAERLNSFISCIVKWLEYPFTGGGLKSVVEISSFLGSNTSTTGTFLVGFGLFFAVLVCYVQFLSISRILNKESVLIKIVFFVMFILQINNHGLVQGDWLWMLTMIGVVYYKLEAYSNSLQSGGLEI